MDRYYTFMYVREDNAGVRTIRIRRVAALAAGLCLIAFLAATVVVGVRYAGIRVDSDRMAGLERENEQLRGRLSSFEVDLDGLKGRMDSNFELQNRARLMASLDPLSEDVWQVGVGGPEPKLLKREISAADHVFTGLENDLDMLVRQTELQKQSYDEIIGILEEEASMRDCTPSIRPLKGGFLSSRFGRRMDPFTGRITRHRGVDYFARTGTPVMASADGVITMAKKNGSMGLTIEVNHGNGFKTRYAHLSKIYIKRGKRIIRGEILGAVGNTGRSTGPHLHYEVIFRKQHRDPLNYIIPEGVYFD
ncbi:MAG: M23 family metallopeptidase [Candidatus Krumholzibacteria bacterium]|nr:M23 family metallopeptidase [Candidatus Krumholzibacteria bacterium]